MYFGSRRVKREGRGQEPEHEWRAWYLVMSRRTRETLSTCARKRQPSELPLRLVAASLGKRVVWGGECAVA
eukprot:4690889-Pleurochrysis_carterae.AAC.1